MSCVFSLHWQESSTFQTNTTKVSYRILTPSLALTVGRFQSRNVSRPAWIKSVLNHNRQVKTNQPVLSLPKTHSKRCITRQENRSTHSNRVIPFHSDRRFCWITLHTPTKTDLLTRTEQSHSFTQIEQSHSSAAIFVGSFWRFTHQETWFTHSDRAVPLSYSDRAIPFYSSHFRRIKWCFTQMENWFDSNRALPI